MFSSIINQLKEIKLSSNNDKTQKSSKISHNHVSEIFNNNSIKKLDYQYSDIIKEYLKNLDKNLDINLDNGLYYYEHIFGSQSYPDFVLLHIINKKFVNNIFIEIKTGNKNIVWNDGLPQKDGLYLYFDTAEKITLMFSYNDLIDDNEQSILSKMNEDVKELNKKYREKLKNSKFYPTIRRATKQKININKFNQSELEENFINKLNEIFPNLT